MELELKALQAEAKEKFLGATSIAQLNELKVAFLGKKGSFTSVMKGMAALSPEERPKFGQLVNEVRNELEALFEEQNIKLSKQELEARLASEKIDITLPGRVNKIGHIHPLSLTMRKIKNIFIKMGFSVYEGPEVESDYYNFEALNLPKEHPARDAQDSFYITSEFLLRTHTSPMQARTMERTSKAGEPVRMIAPGKVYRRDYDATHSPMFHQVEGLVVGENISFADLKGTLELFLQEIFGDDVKVRLRPSFFPFTEPSAEVDISCVICKGAGCRVCKQSGWLEILGSGMVHPRVLEMGGYDSTKYSGYAFGMGEERISMLLYGIDDLRLFFENDLRFIRQFALRGIK